MTGLLKWGSREFVEYNNFAGGCVVVWTVPVEGKVDVTKIRVALDKKLPRESPWGKQMWFTGHHVIEKGELGFKLNHKVKNTVTVEQHYGIAN